VLLLLQLLRHLTLHEKRGRARPPRFSIPAEVHSPYSTTSSSPSIPFSRWLAKKSSCLLQYMG